MKRGLRRIEALMIKLIHTSTQLPPLNTELLIYHEFMLDFHIILYTHESEMNYFKWWAEMPVGEPKI